MINNERVDGEAARRAWREAFRKLGEVNEEDRDFDEQFLKDCQEQVENSIKEENQDQDELDREIDREEVGKAVKTLKTGKAGGFDGIINEMLKNGGEDMIDLLWSLLKKVFEAECIPSSWSKGLIVPLFKGGDRHNTDNYRGIS